MKFSLACSLAMFSCAAISSPVAERWRWTILSTGQIDRHGQETKLVKPELLSSYELERSRNLAHPLTAISAEEQPPYWERPLPSMEGTYNNSVDRFEKVMSYLGLGPGNTSILKEGRLSPETVIEYLQSFGYDERSLKLRLVAAVYLSPTMPGDPKRSVGSKMLMANGEMNIFAGKDLGNWQAGIVTYFLGMSEREATFGAGVVQALQDLPVVAKAMIECRLFCTNDYLDHSFGKDDPRGEKYFLNGRDFAFRREYRRFMYNEAGSSTNGKPQSEPPPSTYRGGQRGPQRPERHFAPERDRPEKQETPSTHQPGPRIEDAPPNSEPPPKPSEKEKPKLPPSLPPGRLP